MANTKRFSLFRRGDRPDALAEDTTPTLGFFFKQLKRKFGKILSLNLMMVFMILPLLIAGLLLFLGTKTPTIADSAHSYSSFLGIHLRESASATPNMAISSVLGTLTEQLNVPVWTTGKTIGFITLIVFTVITWGWQNVGSAYNLRSLVRGDSCFIWSDYFYAIRRNLKQALIFGIMDCLFLAVLLFDFFYFSSMQDVFVIGILYMIFLVLLILYIVMRFYIYHMMVTFDLSTKKLLKNALIFTMLGIKRNFMALLGIVAVIALNLLILIPCLAIGFSVPIILPLFYFPALSGFIATYAAWPNIQRYMIDPYEAAHGTAYATESDDEDETEYAENEEEAVQEENE